jgi:hypothetical protein
MAGQDTDTYFEFGRARVGYYSIADYAGFGHRDLSAVTSYALLQSSAGSTLLNSTGTTYFRISNNTIMTMTAAGLDISAGNLDVRGDENVTSYIGRAAVGYCGHNDFASFAHYDHNTTTNYALRQQNTGATYINCATNQSIAFRCNDASNLMRIDGPTGDIFITNSIATSIPLGCRVYRSTTQTIPNTTSTIISYNGEQADTDSCWSAAAPTRLYARHAGYYVIAANVSWTGNSTGRRNLAILDNAGNNLVAFSTWPGDATLCYQFAMTGMFWMEVNDYVRFQVWQNSGVALDIQASTVANQNFNTAWMARQP